jgi:hypothetical protein
MNRKAAISISRYPAGVAHLVVARHPGNEVTTLCAERTTEAHRPHDLETLPVCQHCAKVLQELNGVMQPL